MENETSTKKDSRSPVTTIDIGEAIEIKKTSPLTTAIDAGEVTSYIKNDFKNEIEKYKKYSDLKTGFKHLDEKINSLNPGIILLGGGSSVGKTTFAINLAYQICENGGKVIFYSLEQTAFEITSKLLSRKSEIRRRCKDDPLTIFSSEETKKPYSAIEIRHGKANAELDSLAKEIADDIGNRFIIRPDPKTNVFSLSFDEIIKEIKEIEIDKDNPKNNPVIFIDYLQSIAPENAKNDSQRLLIDNMTKEFEAVAKNLGLTIFIISSFNRSSYYLPVSYESFKESGGLEYTADIILGLQLQILSDPAYEEKMGQSTIKETIKRNLKKEEAKEHRAIELVCLKNRYGVKDFSCYFEYTPMYDLFVEKDSREATTDSKKPEEKRQMKNVAFV